MNTTVARKRTAEPLAKGSTPKNGKEAKAIADSFSRGKKPPSPTSTTVPAGILEHDPDAWQTLQVPLPSQFLVKLTLYYRQSDAATWRVKGACFNEAMHVFVEAQDIVGTLRHALGCILEQLCERLPDEHDEDDPDEQGLNEALLCATLSWLESDAFDAQIEGRQPPSLAKAAKAAKASAPTSVAHDSEVREILVSSCQPHPANIRPTPGEVEAIKRSFVADGGQLEPIDVRLVGDGFQIISGETRWLAATSLKWRTIKARVRESCDDATAFHLLMVMNAARRELTPIYKARMIEQATRPLTEGGGGKTLEEAGKIYGITSAGGASNLKRLLQLPQIWQDRITSGELPESFARLLLPFAHAPRLMAAIDEDYRRCRASKKEHEREDWEDRRELDQHLRHLFSRLTRPIEKGDTRRYDSDELQVKGDNAWRYGGEYECLIKLTPEIEAELDIVEFNVSEATRQGWYGDYHSAKTSKVRRATNVEAYDRIQIPLIKEKKDKSLKRSAAAAGGKADKAAAKAKKLTPAQQKLRDKEQAEQLAKRINGWRHRWLRQLIGHAIADGKDNGFRLLLAVAADTGDYQVRIADAFLDATSPHALPIDDWERVEQFHGAKEATIVRGIALQLLQQEGRDEVRYPALSFELIDGYAASLGIDLAAAWRDLQTGITKDFDPMLEAFYLLYTSDQLKALGHELGVHLDQAKTRAAMVKLLMTRDRVLAMPKAIPLLKTSKPSPAAKAKKKAK